MGGFGLELSEVTISVNDLDLDYIEFKRSRFNLFGSPHSIKALKNISFTTYRGDIVAIIGKNGAGKSTLLSTLSGRLRPSGGSVDVNGRVVLMSSADPGFFPDMTGRANVGDLALAYGLDNDRIEDFTASVIEFCELGEALDRNFRGYSSGMRGKLGFGFITSLEPDILLIDETLGVGDEEFRSKAKQQLEKFVKKSGTVLISTHSLGLAREMCSRGIVLENGEIICDGDIEEALLAYRAILKQEV